MSMAVQIRQGKFAGKILKTRKSLLDRTNRHHDSTPQCINVIDMTQTVSRMADRSHSIGIQPRECEPLTYARCLTEVCFANGGGNQHKRKSAIASAVLQAELGGPTLRRTSMGQTLCFDACSTASIHSTALLLVPDAPMSLVSGGGRFKTVINEPYGTGPPSGENLSLPSYLFKGARATIQQRTGSN
jgi:hypothetical protein